MKLIRYGQPGQEKPGLLDSQGTLLSIRALDREVGQLHDSGVRVRFIGDAGAFPEELQTRMRRVEQRTAGNTALALNVAGVPQIDPKTAAAPGCAGPRTDG